MYCYIEKDVLNISFNVSVLTGMVASSPVWLFSKLDGTCTASGLNGYCVSFQFKHECRKQLLSTTLNREGRQQSKGCGKLRYKRGCWVKIIKCLVCITEFLKCYLVFT